MRRSRLALTVSAAALAVALAPAPSTSAAAPPSLQVSTVVSGLEHPWDVAFTSDGSMLWTERARKRISLRLPDGTVRVLADSPAWMLSSGETGLMAIEPTTDDPRSFVTCHGFRSTSDPSVRDVRVVRWQMNAERTSATITKNLTVGLPFSTGRHGGCALARGGGHVLYVGTGDAAVGTNPQNRYSLGGKILRIDARTGKPVSGNPYLSSASRNAQRVVSYGHRNVQGLARRPSDGAIYGVEQGSYRDDEVNRLTFGGNYGWNPVPRRSGDPSYNEGANSPMTDDAIAGAQVGAVARTGNPSKALTAGTFVTGRQWGSYDGTLVVTALKHQSIRFITLPRTGAATSIVTPAQFRGTYGRLRAAAQGPDGSLYLSTSNGSNDRILKVTPAG